jgi:hypothetical protein
MSAQHDVAVMLRYCTFSELQLLHHDSVIAAAMLFIPECAVSTGSVFTGYWLKDMRTGQCKMRYADGTLYIGKFKEDVRCGKGTCTYTTGEA